MDEKIAAPSAAAVAVKKKIDSGFFWKGLTIALTSGLLYGFYSAFISLGMGTGIWEYWYGDDSGLSFFVVMFLLGTLGAAINDCISAVWGLGITAAQGKLGDFKRTFNTKPGHMMIIAALAGGPIAGTAYVVALIAGGPIVAPISALCPAIGAILSRFLFKQKLNARMLTGIAVCLIASFLIGGFSVSEEAHPSMFLGVMIALIAAFGWGLEGCVAGYGTSLIDYQIGITIRQCVSGGSNLVILLPIFCIAAGNIGMWGSFLGQALTSGLSVVFFIFSGFFSLYTFSLWYKGNSMCGTALGMSCNGIYSFCVPLVCWIIIGVIGGQEGWNLAPIAWFAAVLMAFGIFLIAQNPLDLFKKEVA